jgi:hypothetical protein
VSDRTNIFPPKWWQKPNIKSKIYRGHRSAPVNDLDINDVSIVNCHVSEEPRSLPLRVPDDPWTFRNSSRTTKYAWL